MLAELHLAYVVLAVVFLLFGLSWRPCQRLTHEGNLAYARGDFARSRDAFRALWSSWSPGAMLMRRLSPGQIEAQIAVAYCLLRDWTEALAWCQRGLMRAKATPTLVSLRQIAAQACSDMGDLPGLQEHTAALQSLAQRTARPYATVHANAIGWFAEIGQLDRAFQFADEAMRASWQRSDTFCINLLGLLGHLGECEAALAIAGRCVQPDAGSTSRATSPDVAAVHNSFRQAMHVDLLLAAAEAAARADRRDLHAQYLAAVPASGGSWPLLQMKHMGHLALEAAWAADRGALQRVSESMDELIATYAEDRQLPAMRARSVGRARQALGEHDDAIAEYQQALAGCMSLLDQSMAHAQLAVSLEAVEEYDAAADHRRRARELAPRARWSHGPEDVFDDHQTHATAMQWVDLFGDDSSSSRPVSTYLDPLPPVASKLACWIWPLSVLSMIPLAGALFGAVLGPLSLWLLARRPRFKHDRRVALAGICFAILSLAIPAVVFFSRLPRLAHHQVPSAKQQLIEATDIEFVNPLPGRSGEVAILAILILSVMLHEIAHGLSAYWAGDPTARDRDRLSLNPVRHVSLVGSIIVPAILTYTGSPVIGWAKPVPVSPHRFRHPRRWSLAVSLAGVSINIMLAMLAANLIVAVVIALRHFHPDAVLVGRLYDMQGWMFDGLPNPDKWLVTLHLLSWTVLINGALAGFNLLPFPPLDGFNALRALLPRFLNRLAVKASGLGMIVFIALIATDLIAYLLLPGMLFAILLLALAQGLSR